MNKDQYIGKIVIAGFTYYDAQDRYVDQKQFHGKIVDVDPEQGIRFVDSQTNQTRVLPPRTDALFPAPRGLYREQATGKTISNPDFISLWHVKKEPGDNNRWEWQPYKADLRIQEAEQSDKTKTAAEPTAPGHAPLTQPLSTP